MTTLPITHQRHRLGGSLLHVCAQSLSCLFVTLWTVAHRAPLHGILWAGILEWVPFPSPGDLPESPTTDDLHESRMNTDHSEQHHSARLRLCPGVETCEQHTAKLLKAGCEECVQ